MTARAVLTDMLVAAENAAPVDAVEAVTRELAAELDAVTVSFLIADLSGRALVRLAHHVRASGGRRSGDEVATVMPFDGGPAERALRTQAVQVHAQGDQWTVLAPVTDRGEVIGLLEMTLPDEPVPGVLREITRTAHALAFVVIANRRHTDLFEWGQRTTSFTLSAAAWWSRTPSPARAAPSGTTGDLGSEPDGGEGRLDGS
jgi:hypothetical protein